VAVPGFTPFGSGGGISLVGGGSIFIVLVLGRPYLSIQPSSPWAVEGERGQIIVRCDGDRSGKLTPWLRSRRAGDWGHQGVDRESPDGEEGESRFEEHGDMECRGEERITMAPGLKFGR